MISTKSNLKAYGMMFLLLCSFAAHAYKITSPGAFCDLTEEQLRNPDVAIRDAMEHMSGNVNSKCARIPSIEQDRKAYYRAIKDYPEGARKKFLKKDYAAVRFFFSQYRIKGQQPGPLVDGRPTLLYEVDLLYVLMHLYEDQCFDGEACSETVEPLCEKATAFVQMGDTPWGWFVLPNPDIGTNLRQEFIQIQKRMVTRFKDDSAYQKELEARMALYKRLASQCKDQL